jgi:hypothetical protein
MNDSPDTAELFLVRVQREHDGAVPGALRGSIVQVSTKRQLSFGNLDDVRDFIILRMEGNKNAL